jgi:hypothetical protein
VAVGPLPRLAPRREKGDSGKRTMGVAMTSAVNRGSAKNIASGPIPQQRDVIVTIVIDETPLARVLGERAIYNRSKESKVLRGIIRGGVHIC